MRKDELQPSPDNQLSQSCFLHRWRHFRVQKRCIWHFVGPCLNQTFLSMFWPLFVAGAGRLCHLGSEHCNECKQFGPCICGCRILQDPLFVLRVACCSELSESQWKICIKTRDAFFLWCAIVQPLQSISIHHFNVQLLQQSDMSEGNCGCPKLTKVASTFWSTVSAVTSRSEADAAYLENESAKRAMQGLDANLDTVDAAASELRDLQRDFTQDDITSNIRAELKALDRGESREFSGLARDQRRKVHLLAGELGMLSQSFGSTKGAKKARTVVVTNPPSQALVPVRSTVESDVQKIVDDLGEEAEAIQGTLQQSGWQVVSVAGVFILGSAASPLLLSTVGGAKLLLPLATGTVGLATAWQETAGKSAVAIAKRQTAFLLTKEARAETFLGRAHLAYAAFPTDVAIATLATIATGLSSVLNLTTLWKCLAMLMVIPAYTACSVAMQRRRKVERFVGASMRCVDAAPIPPPKRFWKQQLVSMSKDFNEISFGKFDLLRILVWTSILSYTSNHYVRRNDL